MTHSDYCRPKHVGLHSNFMIYYLSFIIYSADQINRHIDLLEDAVSDVERAVAVC
jgi:hypothetical protein